VFFLISFFAVEHLILNISAGVNLSDILRFVSLPWQEII